MTMTQDRPGELLDQPIRDQSGKFVPGHKPIDSNHTIGRINGAGRPKSLNTEIHDALEQAVSAMPGIIKTMIERANDKMDRDSQRASEYLVDRIYGKANQPISGLQPVEIIITYGPQPAVDVIESPIQAPIDTQIPQQIPQNCTDSGQLE